MANYIFKNKFYPDTFFKVIDTNTSIKYNYKKPKYNEPLLIAKNHRNIDENNKIYFCGWRRNPSNYNVTKENLEKTKSAFGYKLYDICKKYNISSCWTDNINEEKLIEIDKLIYSC